MTRGSRVPALGWDSFAQRGIDGPAFVRAGSELAAERLGQEPSASILELPVDDQRGNAFLPLSTGPQIHIWLDTAFDAAGIEDQGQPGIVADSANSCPTNGK